MARTGGASKAFHAFSSSILASVRTPRGTGWPCVLGQWADEGTTRVFLLKSFDFRGALRIASVRATGCRNGLTSAASSAKVVPLKEELPISTRQSEGMPLGQMGFGGKSQTEARHGRMETDGRVDRALHESQWLGSWSCTIVDGIWFGMCCSSGGKNCSQASNRGWEN